MEKEEILSIQEKLKNHSPIEVIKFTVDKYKESIIFTTSLSIEDQAITHLICQVSKDIEIITLDTGRLFQETYDTIEKTNKHFGIKIKIYFPNTKDVEEMTNQKGVNLFYESIENRKECCNVRKIIPLQKALENKKAWITGLRKEQSITRYGLRNFEYDENNKIVKINPITNWTEEETLDYIKSNNIPYNTLQDKGYRSIGCMPCTRAISDKDDIRAGRWWWEDPEKKECGLHRK